MKPKELATLVAIAYACFPQYQERDTEATAMAWELTIGDLDFNTARAALGKVLATVKWFPTPAEIREAAVELTAGPQLSAGEAFQLARYAAGRYGLYHTAEAMATLPDLVRKAVQQIGWHFFCQSEEPEIKRAQFRRVYEVIARREQEMAQLPAPMREMLAAASARMALPGGRR